MVKKSSKHGLNTGNTIRRHSNELGMRQSQSYGCLVVSRQVCGNDSKAAKAATKDIDDIIPSKEPTHVQFSLNKRKRWEVPEFLKSKIEDEQDSTDVEVSYTFGFSSLGK